MENTDKETYTITLSKMTERRCHNAFSEWAREECEALVRIFTFDEIDAWKKIEYEHNVPDVKTLRKRYPGKTYILYHFGIVNNRKIAIVEGTNAVEEDRGGYLIVSKREIRERHKMLRSSKDEIKVIADRAVRTYVDMFNNYIDGTIYDVSVNVHDSGIICNGYTLYGRVGEPDFTEILDTALSDVHMRINKSDTTPTEITIKYKTK